jgi:hypothetical protein
MKILNNIGRAWNAIEFFKKEKGMQTDAEDIESLLANMMLEKNFKKPQI